MTGEIIWHSGIGDRPAIASFPQAMLPLRQI
jgi:hypothetical protein